MPFIGNKPSAVPLTSADIADSIITSAKIVDGTIVNADINSSAAITYSKLSLGTSIVNADISASAAIALTKLASTGTLTVDNIQFPATAVASANANNLDDYEEGTFTPTISGSISGSGDPSGGTNQGRYTKIGNLVYVNYFLANVTFPTFAGNLRISLPFTAAGGNHRYHGNGMYFYPNANWETVSNFVDIFLTIPASDSISNFAIYETNDDRQDILYQGVNCNLSAVSGLYLQTSVVYNTA